jgi:hypothetical protein
MPAPRLDFAMRTTRAKFLGGLFAAALPPAAARVAARKQRQAEIRQMARQTLERLYKVQPKAEAAVAKTAGLRFQDPVGTFAGLP